MQETEQMTKCLATVPIHITCALPSCTAWGAQPKDWVQLLNIVIYYACSMHVDDVFIA